MRLALGISIWKRAIFFRQTPTDTQHKVWRAIHNNFVWWKICFVFVRENSLNSFVCWMAKHSVPTVAQVYSELLQINAIYLKNMKNHI